MADIDVERKGTPAWIWAILGLLVLGLLLFLLLTPTRDQVAVVDPATEPMPPPAVVEEPVPVAPAEVEQYMTQCAPGEPAEMGVEHEYTSDCIQRLASAIDAAVPDERLTAVRPQLENARDAAQRLAESPPDALDHSQLARDGLTALASVFESLQQQWYPGLAAPVGELRQSAERIQPDELLLEQRPEVQRFFSQAGGVLNQMTGGQAGRV